MAIKLPDGDEYLRTDKPLCKIGGCGGALYGHGWCKPHWQRWYRTGDPLLVRPNNPSGKASPSWSGDNPSYKALHDRVVSERGPASRCIIFQCDTGSTHYEWANISHQYKDVGDFMEMCKVHHAAHDDESRPRGAAAYNAKLTADQVYEIRAKCAAGGISQRQLGKEYDVRQEPSIRLHTEKRTRTCPKWSGRSIMAIELPDGDSFLTSAEVCAIIGCHRTTLGRYLHDKEAPAGSFLLGRDRLWRKSSVYDWLLYQETIATEETQ